MLKNIRRTSRTIFGRTRWSTTVLAFTLAGTAMVAGSCGDAVPTSPAALAAGVALRPLPSHSAGVDLPFSLPVLAPASLDDRTCNLGIFGGPTNLPLVHSWNVRIVGATEPRTIRVETVSGANDRGALRARLLTLSNTFIAGAEVPYTGANATGDIVASLSAGVYRLTLEAVPTSEPPPAQSGQHYKLGGSAGVELGWAGPLTYGEGSGTEGHRWAINAAGGELVGVSLSVDPAAGGVPTQATSVTYEVRNADGSPGPVSPTTSAVSPSSPVTIGFTSSASGGAYRLIVAANGHYTLHKGTGDPGFYGMICHPPKQSQTSVSIFFDNGPLPPPGEGGQFLPIPQNGVAPGTNLVARIHVGVPGAEGIEGPVTIRLLNNAGAEVNSWIRTTSMQGHVDIQFTAGPVGSYTLTAQFDGASRIGPDGVTTNYQPSFGQSQFLVVVPNTRPVANAGPDQVLFRTSPAGASVTLDGTGSTDAENNIVEYAWFKLMGPGNPPQLLGTGSTLTIVLPMGFHNIELRVRDAGGLAHTDFVTIHAKNVLPVANAGPDQTLECVAGGVIATLTGSGTDLDGTIVSYKWFGLGNPAGVPGQSVQTFPMFIGDRQFRLEVTDNNGARAIDDVRVGVEDTEGPTIHMAVSPTRIWSPNHKMVKVVSGAYATDACSSSNVFGITVTSNEPVNGPGDGNTAPDWNVVANSNGTYDVWVRAERSGNRTGRIYTITARAVDSSGNVSTRTATVEVSHDN